ncbi:MAG: hypothetical protein HWN65_22725 [Candidatus Helarchaeota archaeon]|nr:hypothetical protein [Candidatus Helarchaeota archaeon]
MLSDYRWSEGRSHEVQYYCFIHFKKVFKQKLSQIPWRFIFFKEDEYFGEYIYLSLSDFPIHPAHYAENDIRQISQLLELTGRDCEKYQKQEAKIILMDVRVIGHSVESPLIKDEASLQSNELLCTECFSKYLGDEIKRRRKEFGQFKINLPYDSDGIYIFEQ